MCNSVGLVALNTYEGFVYLKHFTQQLDPDQNFLAFFQHQSVVGSQKWLTLYTVYNQGVCMFSLRDCQLDMCRESSTSQPDDTCLHNLFEYLLTRQSAILDQRIASVNRVEPFVSFDLYRDRWSANSSDVGLAVHGCYSARNRRVNVCRDETIRRTDHLSDQYAISFFDTGSGRSPDVLSERQDDALRKRHVLDRLRSTDFIFRRMDTAQAKTFHKYRFRQIFKY